MSRENKHWRLSTPFRRFSSKQQDTTPPNARVGRPGSRVSSVYLSDDSSIVILPEFDYPATVRTTFQHPTRINLPPNPLPPNAFRGDTTNYGTITSQGPHLGKGTEEDDLAQRLDVAYEYIRSMPPGAPPRVLLSADPQMLRKQLGVPQHSVFNLPIHSSPDLPNPHPCLPEPLSPPAAPLDVLRTTNFGLRTDTDIHPHSSFHLQGPIQTAQSKSVSATPSSTENAPSRCGTFGTSWNGHLSNPRDSTPDTSKFFKHHFKKTPFPLPSSSSDRRALKGVLRKLNTPSSMTTHRRQISLPKIRPPSPFRVNIPLHHTWHDSPTDFNPSAEFHSNIAQHRKKNSRSSRSTEVLASLAWIGTPRATIRKRHSESSTLFPDQLSMGFAVEDDSISDDDLVDRLEMVRRINGPSERGKAVSPSVSSSSTQLLDLKEDKNLLSSVPHSPSSLLTPNLLTKTDIPLSSPLTFKDTISDSEDAAIWQAARKALLCVREIVRTEKKYQEALKMLLNAETTTPPPPSMSPYVSALVRVSEMLLKRFLEDPSAWGVSTAFVTSEDELELTMVSWCTVAGAFFTDENNLPSSGSAGRWRLRKSGIIWNSSSTTKQAPVSLSPQLPPMFPMTTVASEIKERPVDEYCSDHHPLAGVEKQMCATSQKKLESTARSGRTGQPPCRKLSVRDLAIQPIQRVMRYVLLYRDLLDCIPAMSPPRLLVERALEAATRIANHCDGAQRNPAFSPASQRMAGAD